MHENLVLIGAGSAMFTRGLIADLIRQGWEGDLRLVDTDPRALAVAERLARKMIAARQAPLHVVATTNRRTVLPGATAVICTIGVGGRRAWELDVVIPRKYGIYQPVGDSVMPGGSSRCLRMIPAMVAIARDVVELCPEALFFNYGNPMGPVCRAVCKTTGAHMTGLCHGVFHVAGHLAGLLGVPVAKLKYVAAGMNHMTWFTDLRADGTDLMPKLRRIARERLEKHRASSSGVSFAEAGTDGRAAFIPEPSDPFTWELMDLYGAFPAVLDRHVTEFFPYLFARQGAYYGKTLGVDCYSVEATIEYGDSIYREMAAIADSSDPLPVDYFDAIGGEHEQVTEIVESIRTDAGRVYSANLPNLGQVPNLPPGSIVECPAMADATGMHPIHVGPLPSGLCGTLATRMQWVETIVEAALEGSRAKFIQALLLDGAVPSLAVATQLADALLSAHAQYLPQFARSL